MHISDGRIENGQEMQVCRWENQRAEGRGRDVRERKPETGARKPETGRIALQGITVSSLQ
jgi:hypothetical protein